VPSNIKLNSKADWTLEVLSPSAAGEAVVDQELQTGYFLCTWLWPKKMNDKTMKYDHNVADHFAGWLPGNMTAQPTEGHYYRSRVSEDGKFEAMHKDSLTFPMGQFFTQLPKDPVAAGATWNGRMSMITGLTDSKVTEMDASFKLEGFEYHGKYRCARITATHTETGVQIPWDLPGAPASGTGAGGAGGLPGVGAPGMPGAPAGGAMGPAAMGGLPSMMGAGGGTGMAQVGPDGEPEGTLKGDITITRVAYFAVDEGRFIAFQDTVHKQINKILAPPDTGGAMGGPGMGGGPGAGAAMEMQPLDYRGLDHLDATSLMGALVGQSGAMLGGMMSAIGAYGNQMNQAMNGGAPGMMPPGGGPGAPGGMAQVQMEPPVPAVINIDTTLSVEEVRQTAGHALDPQQASL
jgi:hypothetical protein